MSDLPTKLLEALAQVQRLLRDYKELEEGEQPGGFSKEEFFGFQKLANEVRLLAEQDGVDQWLPGPTPHDIPKGSGAKCATALNLPGYWIKLIAYDEDTGDELGTALEEFVPVPVPSWMDTMNRMVCHVTQFRRDYRKLLESFVGAQAVECAKIAADNGKSVNQRLLEICALDNKYAGPAYDSPWWADLLDCSDAAIRKTRFWKERAIQT